MDFTAENIQTLWKTAGKVPGGRWFFSWMVGKLVPYTGSVHPYIEVLEPGFATVTMQDRPSHRNHLRSIHAIALANLAEFTGSLAIASRVPPSHRWIVTGLTLQYQKKARGQITAVCDFQDVDLPDEEGPVEATVTLQDEDQEVVSEALVTLRIGRRKSS